MENTKKVLMYTRFERFWHWTQFLFIAFLIFSGLEIRGVFKYFGFEQSITYHNIVAWALMILIAFAIFWHFVTGEWKQYIPTNKNLFNVAKYYLMGIFKGEIHPHQKNRHAKLNPLQKIAYLQLKALILPAQILSGLLYFFYHDLDRLTPYIHVAIRSYLPLEWVALVHVVSAYSLLAFIVVHVYLTTTGHTVFAHIHSMITGYEELEEEHH